MHGQDAALRAGNFEEVTRGYGFDEVLRESGRCLMCADAPCIAGCPVGINIPGFIRKLTERNYRGAYDILTDTNLLPSICGRVCPQEDQCEKACTVGDSLEPVAIGRLERFVGDIAISEGWINTASIEPNRFRVGIVGSGPAGIACAGDMARAGCDVTVYEALDQPGGVLRYGIPDFRLPTTVIDADINHLRELGVRFECNAPVGRLFTIEQMIADMGFHAVFVGVGAGHPAALAIPGESLEGVISAAELLRARNMTDADSSLPIGKRVAVIGADNMAIDAARVLIRMGSEKLYCTFLHARTEAPARKEEVDHAEQEGVEFHWLTRPVSILDDGKGRARGVRCVRMALDESDDARQRLPVAVAGSEFDIEADLVVYATGTRANPVIGQTSKLALNREGYIGTDENLATSVAGVFAGGDIVTGGATVIEAMGAGRRAARSMMAYLGIRDVMRAYVNADGSNTLFGIDTRERNLARVRITETPPGMSLDAADGANLRPALFSRYRELAELRHDFPVVLIAEPTAVFFAQPLSGIIDRALETAARGLDSERIRKHALRLEQMIRTLVFAGETGSLAALWDKAASLLPNTSNQLLQDSLRRTRSAIRLDGELTNCDANLPARLLRHAWAAVERQKADALREDIERLTSQLSDILKNDPNSSAERLNRLRATVEALNTQEVFPAPGSDALLFNRCADALDAFRAHMPQLIQLARTIATAELEINGSYNQFTHDALFQKFGSDGLDPQDLARFPAGLVCVNATEMRAAERDQLMDVLASGLPIKVLLQIDDILGNTQDDRQLARVAIGLDTACVVQSASSNLVRFGERLHRGLAYGGPALFSVFSGASGGASGLPPYLVAAAAMDSRAFPAFSYDPSTAADGPSRLCLDTNSQADLDWPVHSFAYENEQHQRLSVDLAFTLADFVASDIRYARHLAYESLEMQGRIPTLLLVNADNILRNVIIDEALTKETMRCREMWRGLQDLGGIQRYDSPAEKRAAQAATITPAEATQSDRSPGDAYVETRRCSSCDECIRINRHMFAYDHSRHAFIADIDAGTYAQLVEAAESCQVSVIHPGKPRNPSEPGLEELLKRAEPFL